MPSNWLYVDSNFPSFSDDQSTDEKLDSVQNYLYMLVEQLRYQLFNLDETNLNETAKVELIKKITEPIEAEIENLDTGDYTSLVIEGGRAKLQIRNKDGDTAYWYQTADGFILAASDAESMGQYAFAAEGMLIKVSDEEGGQYATISETVNGLRSEVYDGAGNSVIAQTAETISAVVTGSGSTAQLNMAKSGIQLGVTNGEKSATITLSGNGIALQSRTIQFTGSVLFASDLDATGTTKIDGGRIQTGTIDASKVNLRGLLTVYSGQNVGGYMGYTSSNSVDRTAGICLINSTGTSGVMATGSGAAIKTATGAGTLNEVVTTNAQAYIKGGYSGNYYAQVSCTRPDASTGAVIDFVTVNGTTTRKLTMTKSGSFMPATNYLTSEANNYNLGTTQNRWYYVCGVNSSWNTSASTWSDRNAKQNITYDLAQYAAFYDALRPTPFMYKDNQSGRTHTGFISQDVEQALIDNGLTSRDFGGFVIERIEEGEPERYALRYEEFIALNTWQIQQLKARVAELERRLA